MKRFSKLIHTIPQDGYRGIWYSNQPSRDEYVYKYSGGLGTYPSNHVPMAIYAHAVNKTFFCYGGTRKDKNQLVHMVSYYDHNTHAVPRPRLIMDKGTDDAHDNPTIMLDAGGYIWIFSSSHGVSRPSFIYRSQKPYEIDTFERILKTNFSYPECWHVEGNGFLFLHTKYLKIQRKNVRTLCWSTSEMGIKWKQSQILARVEQGHYQIGWKTGKKVATAFNFHPTVGGLNARTNLYYIQTEDLGQTWTTAENTPVSVPLTTIDNAALVRNYQNEQKLVYLIDIAFDPSANPILLFLTSNGYESGPKSGPRTWTIAHWKNNRWRHHEGFTSDSNYDVGCLHVLPDRSWLIIGPTGVGPQPFNPGGEMEAWQSHDEGMSWKKAKILSEKSPYNHTYARKPVNANPEFLAFWADGHARQRSPSRLYFYDHARQKVCQLPELMENDMFSFN